MAFKASQLENGPLLMATSHCPFEWTDWSRHYQVDVEHYPKALLHDYNIVVEANRRLAVEMQDVTQWLDEALNRWHLMLIGVVSVEFVFLKVDEFDVVVELWSDIC